MKKIRIIPRLDIKGPNVIKGIHLEGLRVVGRPNVLAKKYYEQGADEIIYIDSVASLYGRDNLLKVIKLATKDGVFVPMGVGGGIKTIEDITAILRAGADKICINTGAVRNPDLIQQGAEKFGSQCIVLSVEALNIREGKWEVFIENGREETGIDAVEWVKKAVGLGAGEILLTSIDQEGTKKGFDIGLIKEVSSCVSVPIIASGGAGKIEDIANVLQIPNVDAVAIASMLHYNETTIERVKNYLKQNSINVRVENKSRFNFDINRNLDKKISIVDYDIGNLRSVSEAFKFLGCNVKIVNSKEEIEDSDYLVVPGVGAFGDGINNLKKAGLVDPIKKHAEKGKPILGICLGAQILMTQSEEFGIHQGLDLIPGEIKKFKSPEEVKELRYRVPHIGWNSIKISSKTDDVFKQIRENTSFYFDHSYFLKPEKSEHFFAKTEYGNQQFASIIRNDKIIGCQFHPEKSGRFGLKILEEFCKL